MKLNITPKPGWKKRIISFVLFAALYMAPFVPLFVFKSSYPLRTVYEYPFWFELYTKSIMIGFLLCWAYMVQRIVKYLLNE